MSVIDSTRSWIEKLGLISCSHLFAGIFQTMIHCGKQQDGRDGRRHNDHRCSRSDSAKSLLQTSLPLPQCKTPLEDLEIGFIFWGSQWWPEIGCWEFLFHHITIMQYFLLIICHSLSTQFYICLQHNSREELDSRWLPVASRRQAVSASCRQTHCDFSGYHDLWAVEFAVSICVRRELHHWPESTSYGLGHWCGSQCRYQFECPHPCNLWVTAEGTYSQRLIFTNSFLWLTHSRFYKDTVVY